MVSFSSITVEAIEGSRLVGVIDNVEVRNDASESSELIGEIPKGGKVRLLGVNSGGFSKVEYEREEGTLTGWVPTASLKVIPLAPTATPGKILVPEDEGILLRRKPTFFYGAGLGVNFSIIYHDVFDVYYTGSGLTVAGLFGAYLDPRIPVRVEIAYTQANGTSADSPSVLEFGFLDIALVPHFLIEPFELSLALQYSVGLSLLDLPPGTRIERATDLSSLWGQAGVGYRIRLGFFSDLIFRLRYGFSFQQTLFDFHTIAFVLAWQVNG